MTLRNGYNSQQRTEQLGQRGIPVAKRQMNPTWRINQKTVKQKKRGTWEE